MGRVVEISSDDDQILGQVEPCLQDVGYAASLTRSFGVVVRFLPVSLALQVIGKQPEWLSVPKNNSCLKAVTGEDPPFGITIVDVAP